MTEHRRADADDGQSLPVDTVDEPHEPVVVTASSRRLWVHMLIGPTIWIVHFLVVYLLAEWACDPVENLGPPRMEGAALITPVTAITVVAAASAGVAATVSWRSARRDGGSLLHMVGWMLSAGSALTILAVGLPILWLSPC